MAKAIPDGYHSVTPYLTMSDAAQAIAFYTKALGAKEVVRMPMGGKIGHAEIKIGDSMIMLADEMPQAGNKSPKTVGGCPIGICIYTEDVESLAKRFVDAG